jgi:predicted small lipoprotein YifL
VFRFFRQQRKTITSFALVAWLFALFVGIAHACGLDEPTTAPPDVVAANPGERPADTGTPDACEQFCKTDVPVVSKLQFLGDQPDPQPLIVAVRDLGIAVASPPVLQLAPAAHPHPDAAAFLRFAHLRL